MKFAVIHTGGKQYKVSEGDALRIERIKGAHKVGDSISFDKVLLKADDTKVDFGTPEIKDGTVSAELLEIGRAKKINVIKYKQKSRYFKKMGHRQDYFKIKIKSV